MKLSKVNKAFLKTLLEDRINMWENYIFMVENSTIPIYGTNVPECKLKVKRATKVLEELAAA